MAADELPIDEDTPFRPLSPYATSKIVQDLLGLQYYLTHHLHVVRVRPFNHIGPRQRSGFVTPDLAQQIAGGRDGIAAAGDRGWEPDGPARLFGRAGRDPRLCAGDHPGRSRAGVQCRLGPIAFDPGGARFAAGAEPGADRSAAGPAADAAFGRARYGVRRQPPAPTDGLAADDPV